MGGMKINYITFGSLHRDERGQVTSSMASARYRILLPAREIGRLGHEVNIHATDESFWREQRYRQLEGDVTVFCKSFDTRNETLARALQQAGQTVALDICDNHFEHPVHGAHFRRMVEIADCIVASTVKMAEIIHDRTGRRALVIGDPVEGVRGTARFNPDRRPLRALWFGHPLNLDSLFAGLPDLASACARCPMELAIVTAIIPGLREQVLEWNSSHSSLQLFLAPWSPETAVVCLRECDVVLIPSLSDNTKIVKSPNRLLEGIWAGRPVLAYPLPSYTEFQDYAILHTHLGSALEQLLRSPEAMTQKIQRGQDYIARHYLPEHMAARWLAVLNHTAPVPEMMAASAAQA